VHKTMLYKLLALALVASASAFRPTAAALRPRPALRSTAAAPSMLVLPDADLPQACADAMTFASSHMPSYLLANEATAQEIDATLIAQLAVIGAMLAAGFALDTWGEVYEPEEPGAEPGSIDIYRDSPLRYMGYANECGEAFRPLIDVSIVYITYVGAITYILADTYDKGKKGSNVEKEALLYGVLGATDTFLWQMLASVIYPSFCINRLVLLLVSLQASPACPELFTADWLPTAAGLISIPLLIKPLDALAHQTLNLSFRRVSVALSA